MTEPVNFYCDETESGKSSYDGLFLSGSLVIRGDTNHLRKIFSAASANYASGGEIKGNVMGPDKCLRFIKEIFSDERVNPMAFNVVSWDKRLTSVKTLFALIYDSEGCADFIGKHTDEGYPFQSLFIDIVDSFKHENLNELHRLLNENNYNDLEHLLGRLCGIYINSQHRPLLSRFCVDALEMLETGKIHRIVRRKGAEFCKTKSPAFECFMAIASDAAKWALIRNLMPTILHDRTDKFGDLFNRYTEGYTFLAEGRRVSLPKISYVDSMMHPEIQICDALLWLFQYHIRRGSEYRLSEIDRVMGGRLGYNHVSLVGGRALRPNGSKGLETYFSMNIGQKI